MDPLLTGLSQQIVSRYGNKISMMFAFQVVFEPQFLQERGKALRLHWALRVLETRNCGELTNL